MTYCNARLPQALIVSGAWHGAARHGRGRQLRSLEWLMSVQCSDEGYFAPIGSNGFYDARRGIGGVRSAAGRGVRDGVGVPRRAPIDGNPKWVAHARRAFNWFLGQNQLQQWLYDPSTGGCRDGLHADRVNENQGAESTLSFLLALVEMRSTERVDVMKPLLVGASL